MGRTIKADEKKDLDQQAQSLEKEHEKLHSSLLELRRVTSMQLQADSPRTWDAILGQKQHLLDQIEAADLGTLFLHTSQVLGRLSSRFQTEMKRLNQSQLENLSLVKEVSEIEAKAESRLQTQLKEIQTHLSKAWRSTQVSNAYRGRTAQKTGSSRFLDSKR